MTTLGEPIEAPDAELVAGWLGELAAVAHEPDLALVAALEAEALRRGLDLIGITAGMYGTEALTAARGSWSPDLHPRGHDGKFIEKLGLIKLLNAGDLSNRRAQVESIEPDPRSPGNPNVRVRLLDRSGHPSSVVTVKPRNVEQAPEKARLNGPAPRRLPPTSRVLETGASMTPEERRLDEPGGGPALRPRAPARPNQQQQELLRNASDEQLAADLVQEDMPDDLVRAIRAEITRRQSASPMETVTGQQLTPSGQPSPWPAHDGARPIPPPPPGPWEPTTAPRRPTLTTVGDHADEYALRRYARENNVPPGTRVAFTVDQGGDIMGGEEWLDSGEEPRSGQKWAWVDVDAEGNVTTEPRARTLEERRQDLIADINAGAAELSTDDPEERARGLDAILAKLRFSIIDTDAVHDRIPPPGGDSGRWTPERHAQHEEMWEELLGNVEAAGIPQEHDAFVLGGLPGAGKSSALRPGGPAAEFGVTAWEPGTPIPEGATHVSVNPDIVKEMLIDKGMLPEGITSDLKPMEQVTFLHEESSYLAKQFSKRLGDLGYNVVLDNTMDSEHGMLKRMTPLARQGYTFRGLFVDIPVDESLASAKARYERGALTPKGGRFVPSSVMGNRSSTRGTMSKNRDAMDDLVADDWFTDWAILDNTGISTGTPRNEIVGRGTGNGSATAKWQGDLVPGAPPAAAPAAPAGVEPGPSSAPVV